MASPFVSVFRGSTGSTGSGFKVQGSGFRVQGSGFRVQGSGFRVQGSGFRVQGCGGGFAANIYGAMPECLLMTG